MNKQDMKSEIRVIIGKIIIIYEAIQKKGKADSVDWKVCKMLIREFHDINYRLNKTMYPFNPFDVKGNIETFGHDLFYEDWEDNEEHAECNDDIIEGQIEVLKELIDMKRGIGFSDEKLAVELGLYHEFEGDTGLIGVDMDLIGID